MGFNLRPLEVSAAIGQNQLKRLKHFSIIRKQNRNKIINSLKNHAKWNNQYYFVIPDKNLNPSWFGLPLLLNRKLNYKKK